LLKSVLIFSAILVFITEFTSAFHLINFQFILMSWSGIFILSTFYLFSKKEKLLNFNTILIKHSNNIFNGLNKFEKFLFFSVITILVLIFIQGIVYPPNNWDSMTYHLARITNWISHQSVEHYPTHIFRQIYQPPFSEFVIMHFNILNCGDYFSNSVQFFFLIFSLFAIVSIVESFELSRRYKLIAIVLAVTIPEVILQASSTQNDIVVSFFILTSIYFSAKAVKDVNFQTFFFLGLSVGLGVLTKGTAYIYLAPVLLIFTIAIFIRLFKTKNFAYLGYSIIVVIIFITINSGHYIRNYNFNNNILGVNNYESKVYSNEKMTCTLLISNILKNIGLHISPYPLNRFSNKVIYKLHQVLDVDINDPNTSFYHISYCGAPDLPNHENNAPNPIHFILIIVAVILIGLNIHKTRRFSGKILLYFLISVCP
jgi:hypothetical protein